MKFFKAALLGAVVIAVAPAAANGQDTDFSAIQCKQFIAAKREDIGAILMWLEGYYTKPDAKPIMSASKMTADAKALGQYCKEHGEDGLIKAADTVMPRK